MKHGVNFHRRGELQSIRLGANSFGNRIWTKTFPIQLLRWALSGDVRGGEPDFVADGKLDMLVLGVVIAGLVVLHGFDVFDQIIMMGPEVFCEGFRGGNGGRRT